jgi:hypothetical protein
MKKYRNREKTGPQCGGGAVRACREARGAAPKNLQLQAL